MAAKFFPSSSSRPEWRELETKEDLKNTSDACCEDDTPSRPLSYPCAIRRDFFVRIPQGGRRRRSLQGCFWRCISHQKMGAAAAAEGSSISVKTKSSVKKKARSALPAVWAKIAVLCPAPHPKNLTDRRMDTAFFARGLLSPPSLNHHQQQPLHFPSPTYV